MRWLILSGFGLILGLSAERAGADDATIAYRNARIYTAAGPVIEKGLMVVHQGKIVAVGSEREVSAPANAVIRDLAGKAIIPGLVDTHSHIGIYPRPHVPGHSDGNEITGPVQSGLRALDSIYPDDPGIHMATAGGVTTANIMPGSANVIGGQTSYVKLRGATIEAMRIMPAPVLGGLKMANGENPKGYGGRQQAPGTRMKVAALQREQFNKARDYQRKWADYRKAVPAKKDTPKPDTDLSLEPLVEVLQRKRTVHFHSHRADDLMTALRIAEEFGFEIVLHHVTEGYRVVDELVRRKVPVSLTLVDSPGGKLEAAGLLEENAAILEKAGVLVAINTDDFITESRFFLRTGAIAVRGGMSEDGALRALTLNGARMLHLDDRLGSLERGKDADFVILSGPPFSVYTHVLETYIDGMPVFNRAQKKDWSYQTGGFALANLDRLPDPPADTPLPSIAKTPSEKGPHWEGTPKRFVAFAGLLHTMAGKAVADGAVLVEDGTIRYAGPRAGLKVPEGTPILTAAVVTPGLIDAHTVVPTTGLLNIPADQEQDERSDPNQSDLRVLDGFNPNEPLLQFLWEQGVTVVHALPGRTNVIAGQSGIFRTHGHTAQQMALRQTAGLLINLGEIPKGAYTGRLPSTRMGTASLLRTAFTEARNNLDKRTAAKDEDKKPPTNLKTQALEQALAGKVPVIFSAHRADDLATALRLAAEFKLKPILDLATEGYLMADAIAASRVPVVVHPPMQRVGASMETYNSHLCNAAVLADHKVPVAIGTAFEGYVPKTRVLRHEAAQAMVNGLGYERALGAITRDAAVILGIADRFGSLEPGKVADLVLYDGDPFENTTHVTHTILGGRVIHNRADYLKLPFERRALPIVGGGVGCCMGIW
jgi:imidazolonepropionase-like amidohydrolase